MMCDHDTRHLPAFKSQLSGNEGSLTAIDASVFDRPRTHRGDTGNRHFRIGEQRLKRRIDVLAETPEGVEPTRQQIIKRYVVVPRNHEARIWQFIQKPPGILEFPDARPLGQIARNDQQVRPGLRQCRSERSQDCDIDASKMQIGKMDDDAQAATSHWLVGNGSAARATITRNAPGLMRYCSGVCISATSPSVATSTASRRVWTLH